MEAVTRMLDFITLTVSATFRIHLEMLHASLAHVFKHFFLV